MTHLTLTGYYAGRVICGAEKNSNEQYVHAMYAPIEKLRHGAIATWQPLCEACLKEWDSAAEQESNPWTEASDWTK